MRWFASHRFDRRARVLADRHYSRQKVGSPQFVRPGANCVLVTRGYDALWVCVAQLPEYVDHAWPHAWECTLFRNESAHLSSELIREAVAATRAKLGGVPANGMITTVDAAKVRRKRDPGRCFVKAGFQHVGKTKGGKLVLQMLAHEMPEPEPANKWQTELIA